MEFQWRVAGFRRRWFVVHTQLGECAGLAVGLSLRVDGGALRTGVVVVVEPSAETAQGAARRCRGVGRYGAVRANVEPAGAARIPETRVAHSAGVCGGV